ncbi:hypothetical protein [Phyllobacterium myrsinacearum]|uniref:Spore coat protein n=1 Tax=Phyllobacterium myrsinacearum TaxID=28101 RepID=A0A839EA64_9HYPH|nr:hypothetical protein [Phyllobacterium myrsinacearum]MBA8876771.1 hypothetical protein [Phyllobacterium myrsinacearum]
MSIKSFVVAAVIGISGLALSGCVEGSGSYYEGYGGYGNYYGGYGGIYQSTFYDGPRYGRNYYRRDYNRRDYGRRHWNRRDNGVIGRPDRGNRPGWSGRPRSEWRGSEGRRLYLRSNEGGTGRSHQ